MSRILLLAVAVALLAGVDQPRAQVATASLPPPDIATTVYAGGFVLYSSVRNPLGKMTYISLHPTVAGATSMRVRQVIGRRSSSDARAYGAAVAREPVRTQFARLTARDAGVRTAKITSVRVVRTYAVLDMILSK